MIVPESAGLSTSLGIACTLQIAVCCYTAMYKLAHSFQRFGENLLPPFAGRNRFFFFGPEDRGIRIFSKAGQDVLHCTALQPT
jgi:hypothetical protein